MKKAILFLVVIAAALVLSGCYTTYTTTDGKLAYADVAGAEKGEFVANASYMYILHPSLLTLGDKVTEQLDVAMAEELDAMGANAVKNMAITDGQDIVGLLVRSFTGILGINKMEITGTAVQQ
ncbi:MAG: hypothetical protein D6B26_07610 [Spirochaetaceae bacterium]|nr:MAG: hypothetical protein D6B26_07610 [Spirochaetaceae bacterium]